MPHRRARNGGICRGPHGQRLAGHEQLSRYAAIVGVPFYTAQTIADAASMPACYLFAQLAWRAGKPLRWALILAFAVTNAGYLWTVKDPQYVARGATTRELIAILKSRPPGCIQIENFPENPWIAKLSSRFLIRCLTN
jgi:hypothetical protein